MKVKTFRRKRVRFGKTQAYHPNIRQSGLLGRLYVTLLGGVNIGRFMNSFYFRRFLNKLHFSSVLDAGCGKGVYSFYMAEAYPDARVDGCDLSEPQSHDPTSTIDLCEQINKKLKLQNLHFFKQDLENLKAENAYDLVVSIDVIEHIRNNAKVIGNFYNALKKGGHLIVRIPLREQHRILNRKYLQNIEHWSEKEHPGQIYSAKEFVELLTQKGFTIADVKITDGFLGQLAFELQEVLLNYYKKKFLLGVVLPLLKIIGYIDTLIPHKGGNGVFVLARK